ncbi:MAG: hypothetical protein JWM53_6417 [bacterium]|nr:hypothetical protein [bacterium]
MGKETTVSKELLAADTTVIENAATFVPDHTAAPASESAPSVTNASLTPIHVAVNNKGRGFIVTIPPPDPEGVRRAAELLVELATTEVLARIAAQHSDAAEAGTPTASEEKVLAHHRPQE